MSDKLRDRIIELIDEYDEADNASIKGMKFINELLFTPYPKSVFDGLTNAYKSMYVHIAMRYLCASSILIKDLHTNLAQCLGAGD